MAASNEVREFIYASNAEVEADNVLYQLSAESPLKPAMITRQEKTVKEARRRRKTAELNAYGFIIGEDSYL